MDNSSKNNLFVQMREHKIQYRLMRAKGAVIIYDQGGSGGFSGGVTCFVQRFRGGS